MFAENIHDRHISDGRLFAAFSVRCTCGSETLVLLRNVAGKDISVDTIEKLWGARHNRGRCNRGAHDDSESDNDSSHYNRNPEVAFPELLPSIGVGQVKTFSKSQRETAIVMAPTNPPAKSLQVIHK